MVVIVLIEWYIIKLYDWLVMLEIKIFLWWEIKMFGNLFVNFLYVMLILYISVWIMYFCDSVDIL